MSVRGRTPCPRSCASGQSVPQNVWSVSLSRNLKCSCIILSVALGFVFKTSVSLFMLPLLRPRWGRFVFHLTYYGLSIFLLYFSSLHRFEILTVFRFVFCLNSFSLQISCWNTIDFIFLSHSRVKTDPQSFIVMVLLFFLASCGNLYQANIFASHGGWTTTPYFHEKSKKVLRKVRFLPRAPLGYLDSSSWLMLSPAAPPVLGSGLGQRWRRACKGTAAPWRDLNQSAVNGTQRCFNFGAFTTPATAYSMHDTNKEKIIIINYVTRNQGVPFPVLLCE